MLSKLKKFLDYILETALWVMMTAMTLTVLWQVFTRFVIKNPSSWTEELAIFLLIWIGLLGSAVALKYKAHLGIDIIVSRLSPAKQKAVGLFVCACIAFFCIAVLLFGGIKLVAVVLMNNQLSPALQIKMGYVYLALPISGIFMLIYTIELAVEVIKAPTKTMTEKHPELSGE